MDIVTGASGLLGSHLVKALAADGRDVRAFDFRRSDEIPAGATFFQGDVRDGKAVSAAMNGGADTVYHLAALMHVGNRDSRLVRSVNIGGLKTVMQCAGAAGARRIVFTSTIELYGVKPACPCLEDSPKNPPPGYPAHKLLSEKMLAEFSRGTGIESAFTRMPMILGEGFYHFKAILLSFELIRRNLPIVIPGDGTKKGRMVHIADAVQGLRLCADTPGINGEAFNICADDVFTHRGLIEDVIGRVGSKSRVFAMPDEIPKRAFECARAFGLSPVAPEHFLFSLHDCDYTIDKAKRVLGYAPKTGAAAAMAETYESYLARGRRDLAKQLANDLLARSLQFNQIAP
jgi:2-alkyl-3-oxoalkanoate reductase